MPYLCYLNNYNIFLRESSRKLYSKTHQIALVTRNLGSIFCYTPKDSAQKYIICYFYIKNDYFLNYFFDKILAKYSLNRTKLHHFLKFSRGSMSPNPPSERVALHAMQIPPLFQKNFEPPPPPPEMKS